MEIAPTLLPSINGPDCERLAWRVDDFTDPWAEPETVVMIYGLAESGEAFGSWVPYFSRDFRVIRLDLRGYGASSPMPELYVWQLDRLISDVCAVLEHLKIQRTHLVGAKIGGTIALELAARYPERVARVAAVGSPVSLVSLKADTEVWRRQIAEQGVEAWVRATQEGRMGKSMKPDQLEWWTRLMSRTQASTLLGFLRMVPTIDISELLHKIIADTLVVTTTGSGLGSVEKIRVWQQRICRSSLLAIEGTSYHVAASDPDVTAAAVRKFLRSSRDC